IFWSRMLKGVGSMSVMSLQMTLFGGLMGLLDKPLSQALSSVSGAGAERGVFSQIDTVFNSFAMNWTSNLLSGIQDFLGFNISDSIYHALGGDLDTKVAEVFNEASLRSYQIVIDPVSLINGFTAALPQEVAPPSQEPVTPVVPAEEVMQPEATPVAAEPAESTPPPDEVPEDEVTLVEPSDELQEAAPDEEADTISGGQVTMLVGDENLALEIVSEHDGVQMLAVPGHPELGYYSSIADGTDIYFSPVGFEQAHDNLTLTEQQIIYDIDHAQDSIDFAIYGLNRQSIVDALVRAHERDIDVRVVVDAGDGERDYGEYYNQLSAAGIPVTAVNKSNIMHDKFFVIDSEIVWMGTQNMTETCLTVNNNASVRFVSEEMADIFTGVWENIQSGHRRDDASPAAPIVLPNGMSVQVVVTPTDAPMATLAELVRNADTEIQAAIFAFSANEVGEAMVQAADPSDGTAVQIDLITDEGFVSESQYYWEVHRLRGLSFDSREGNVLADEETQENIDIGVATRGDTLHVKLHLKMMVIDGETSVIGSTNWSAAADSDNDEIYVIVQDERFADALQMYFEEAAQDEGIDWIQGEGFDLENLISRSIESGSLAAMQGTGLSAMGLVAVPMGQLSSGRILALIVGSERIARTFRNKKKKELAEKFAARFGRQPAEKELGWIWQELMAMVDEYRINIEASTENGGTWKNSWSPDAVAATSPSDIREGIFFGEYIEGEKGILNRFVSEYPMHAEDGDTSFIRVLQGFVSRAQRSGLSDLVSDLCGRIMKERAGLISEPVPDPLTGLLPGEKPSIAELKKPEVEIREVPLREATPALDIPQAGEAVTAERPDEQERFKEILAASVEQVFRNVALPEGRMELIRNLIRDTEITADLTTRGPPSLTLHTGRYILRLSHEQFNDLSQGKISDTGIFILLAQLAHELVFKDYYSHYSIEREELNSFIHKFTAIYDKAVSLTGIDKEKVDELYRKIFTMLLLIDEVDLSLPYNPHGIGHIHSLLGYLDQILTASGVITKEGGISDQPGALSESLSGKFKTAERSIVLAQLTVLMHDLGYSRFVDTQEKLGHSDLSGRIIVEMAPLLRQALNLTETEYQELLEAVINHEGASKLTADEKNRPLLFLIKFADKLDITAERNRHNFQRQIVFIESLYLLWASPRIRTITDEFKRLDELKKTGKLQEQDYQDRKTDLRNGQNTLLKEFFDILKQKKGEITIPELRQIYQESFGLDLPQETAQVLQASLLDTDDEELDTVLAFLLGQPRHGTMPYLFKPMGPVDFQHRQGLFAVYNVSLAAKEEGMTVQVKLWKPPYLKGRKDIHRHQTMFQIYDTLLADMEPLSYSGKPIGIQVIDDFEQEQNIREIVNGIISDEFADLPQAGTIGHLRDMVKSTEIEMMYSLRGPPSAEFINGKLRITLSAEALINYKNLREEIHEISDSVIRHLNLQLALSDIKAGRWNGKKQLVFDYDNTLSNTDTPLSAETAEVLAELIKQGYEIVIVSGNNITKLHPHLAALFEKMPEGESIHVLTANGSEHYQFKKTDKGIMPESPTPISVKNFSEDEIDTLYKDVLSSAFAEFAAENPAVLLEKSDYADEKLLEKKVSELSAEGKIVLLHAPRKERAEKSSSDVHYDFIIMNLTPDWKRERALRDLQKRIKAKIEIETGKSYSITIGDVRAIKDGWVAFITPADKENTLRYDLPQITGISADETAAFGDSFQTGGNDRGMGRVADFAWVSGPETTLLLLQTLLETRSGASAEKAATAAIETFVPSEESVRNLQDRLKGLISAVRERLTAFSDKIKERLSRGPAKSVTEETAESKTPDVREIPTEEKMKADVPAERIPEPAAPVSEEKPAEPEIIPVLQALPFAEKPVSGKPGFFDYENLEEIEEFIQRMRPRFNPGTGSFEYYGQTWNMKNDVLFITLTDAQKNRAEEMLEESFAQHKPRVLTLQEWYSEQPTSRFVFLSLVREGRDIWQVLAGRTVRALYHDEDGWITLQEFRVPEILRLRHGK
ncbi:MAG TPA: phospholipase D-like domain-containing protein, partial [bacterium]|nr:phospholipase D-like domain-containing protein [bacterium]